MYNKYLDNKDQLDKCLPDDFYYSYVDSFLTNYHFSVKFDNKNLYDLYYPDVLKPKCVARKIEGAYLNDRYMPVSIDEVVKRCVTVSNVIIKQTQDTYGGFGVQFVDECDKNIEKLKSILKSGDNFIIQEIIQQHDTLAAFNPQSINTIRIMTLFYDGEPHFMSAVLRMGINGAKVDNCSSGGIVCGISEDGRLKNRAFDNAANVYYKHPQGMAFEGIEVPSFHKCVETALRLSLRLTNVTKLVSWDFSVDKEGNPILIESNLTGGELDFHQLCNGPIWGDRTVYLLKKVFEESPDIRKRLNFIY